MIAIIGAGTMGRGIAEVALVSGFKVAIFDADQAVLGGAKAQIAEALDRAIAKGKLAAETSAVALGRLQVAESLDRATQDAELVIEAVPENLELKKAIFSCLDAPGALLASNTSSLSISDIAQATSTPERVVGMHFFNPPAANKLLEIVRGEQTSDVSIARARDYGEKLGREVIVVADTPGFASSRLGVVLALEAIRMLEQGVASAADIDRAMESGYRHAMGPLKTTDLVGLDIRLSIAESLQARLLGAQYEPPALLRRLVTEGKLGKKSGEGFYKW